MWRAVVCLLLASCGPVHLGIEEGAQTAGSAGEPGLGREPSGRGDADAATDTDTDMDVTPPAEPSTPAGASGDMGSIPAVTVRITLLDCGRCFELQAAGSGGQPPYDYQWNDGTLGSQRVICVQGSDLSLSVVARDATAKHSKPYDIRLQRASGDVCPDQVIPTQPEAAQLCLRNGSFEGTPGVNFGQAEPFDAAPWSTCTNPSDSSATSNTPDIGDDSLAQTLGPIPAPTEGKTFIALGEGEQVSQAFCSPLPDDAPVSFAIDLTRINIGAGIVPETEQVFLEVWGGLSVDCSRRDLLWASPALAVGWQRFCITFKSRSFITQLTLRANSDMSLPTPVYLLADNLRAVDSCP